MIIIIGIKLILCLICGALDAWGGHSYHNARRFIMPLVIAISVSYFTGIWWIGACCLPAMGTLCIGYSDRGNAWRGLWLFLQAISLGLGLSILNHLPMIVFIPYLIGAGLLGGIYRNWKQLIGDFVTGSYLGLIILCAH